MPSILRCAQALPATSGLMLQGWPRESKLQTHSVDPDLGPFKYMPTKFEKIQKAVVGDHSGNMVVSSSLTKHRSEAELGIWGCRCSQDKHRSLGTMMTESSSTQSFPLPSNPLDPENKHDRCQAVHYSKRVTEG